MKRMISFGSIEQFRSTIKNIKQAQQYIGQNDEDRAMYDKSIPLPTVTCTISEKVHGSNAGVCYSEPDGFWVQSRKNIITVEKDNAACAFNAEANKEHWMKIILSLAEEYKIDLTENIITVFYEWAGGNIQKHSCLDGLEKRAMIFQYFKVSPIEPSEEESAYWLETKIVKEKDGKKYDYWVSDSLHSIFNVMRFKTWSIDIDFERADVSQNKLIEMLEEIEHDSPMGNAFGKEGNISEGFVIQFMFKDVLYRFKVKGEKHSRSKVKTLKPVDSVKEQKLIDFANYATPAWRLEQAWQEVFGINNEKEEPNQKRIGDIIRLVVKDVWKEESDIAFEKGIEPKEVNGKISRIVSNWIQEELNKEVF
jgi:hypothetical protein